MKNILIMLCFTSCVAIQPLSTKHYLVIADKPTTASKETLQKVLGFDSDNSITPSNFLVVKGDIYSNRVWRTTLMLYYQSRVGTFWEVVDSFPVQGEYPQIQKVEQPKKEVLIVWMTLCKDLTVTRSYALHSTSWTPH